MAIFNLKAGKRSIFLLLAFLILLIINPVIARAETGESKYISISPAMEIAMYSPSGMTFGGGLSLIYGKGVSVGLKAVYFADSVALLEILELNLLLRYYFFGSHSGPFVQFSGGPSLLFRQKDGIKIPANWGMISAGFNLGWRLFLNNHFFIEPSVRGGYPYIGGAALSAGIHF